MGDSTSGGDDQVRRERDLYRALLELSVRDEIEPFLDEALSLVVQLTGARRGYIELVEDRGDDGPPRFWMAHGCYDDDVEAIRAVFSRGIIAQAIASGKTIAIASALQDPRYAALKSVQRNLTEAVLCAPLGAPHIGVIYLQDRSEPGPFTEEHCRVVEDVARYLAKSADRLLQRQRRLDEEDHTAATRKKLRADGIIGRSKALARVLQQASMVAPRDVSVLVTGPSGTGKSQLARLIHDNSPRAGGPFVEQNCAALSASVLESELFGHEAGAFTDAKKGRKGLFLQAHKGTIFLDEIGELPLEMQPKLLHVLQERRVRPVGSDTEVACDVRVIAATNADLKALIARKAFREDLYYRLEKAPIRMPSLAERPEDVALLATYFCERACASAGGPRLRLGVGALRALEAATWPGNVRELANCVERAVMFAAEGVLELDSHHVLPPPDGTTGKRLSFQEQVRLFRKQLVERTLDEAEGNRTEAAKLLELSRAHLYNLIDEFWPDGKRR